MLYLFAGASGFMGAVGRVPTYGVLGYFEGLENEDIAKWVGCGEKMRVGRLVLGRMGLLRGV